MHTATWSLDDREFQLDRDTDRVTLSVDGSPVLVGPPPVYQALSRRILAVVRGRPLNAGLPWSPEDDEALAIASKSGETHAELAVRFSRSRTAIRARLAHLGLVEDDGSWRRFTKAKPK